MTRMTAVTGSSPATGTPEEQRLRAATKQLEGVFVQELFKAMRETVPQDGLTNGGAGEDIFTGLMDEKIAAHAPEQWERGIGESLYRQLRAALPHANGASSASSASSANSGNHGAAPAAADDKRTK
jgi:flagellar protein FlgJ